MNSSKLKKPQSIGDERVNEDTGEDEDAKEPQEEEEEESSMARSDSLPEFNSGIVPPLLRVESSPFPLTGPILRSLFFLIFDF